MNVFDLIKKEEDRQKNTVELIASENFVSNDVLRALGSCLTNKYTEGYPTVRSSGKTGRYYGGCEVYDQLEEYCCDLWRQVFKTNYHVNVQPHSGSNANFAAYMSVLQLGDTILSMDLNDGGHLTHGSPVNFSGKLYNMVFYNVDAYGYIDVKDIFQKVMQCKPQLVLVGASAYPREIPFTQIYRTVVYAAEKVRESVDPMYRTPFFMVDMAHIAGLVAAGVHESPFGVADIITTTTHKTLRGPRGGMIFCKPELAKRVDSAVFPGSQGGPLQNVIAAKAVAAEEALRPEFKTYIKNVVKNSKAMCEEFIRLGFDPVTGGTDNHLFLLDFSRTHPELTGKFVQDLLDSHGITLNKNCVPGETRSPVQTSGVRIGTAAMTTKGYTAKDFVAVADRIAEIINSSRWSAAERKE